MIGTELTGTGSALPKKFLSNDEISHLHSINTSDEWITNRTGIKQRHIVSESENALTLAKIAAQNAIISANIDAILIDAVIVASMTPAQNMPSTASLLQNELKLRPGIAFDLNVACSGFIYGINIVDMLIKNGNCKCALLVGVDVMSSVLNWQDRNTCILFGDGAGAVIIQASETNKLYGGIMNADGNYSCMLDANPMLSMQGREVFKHAVKELEKLVPSTLEKFNLKFSDIDWLVAHQANIRIIQATAKLLNLPMEKAIVTVDKHANTAAASIPLALDYAVKTNKVKKGECLLLEAFGAGFSWGSFVMRY